MMVAGASGGGNAGIGGAGGDGVNGDTSIGGEDGMTIGTIAGELGAA